jgi:hypothetical protein
MAELWVDRGIGHRGARSLMSPRWFRVFPAAWWLGFRFGGGVQRPILAVALPVEGIGGATALPLLACRAGDRVSAEACQHSQRPNGSAHPPPARRWCCCHTLKPSPQHPIHNRRTGRATGMNRNGFPRQYPTHPIVDNAPPTWDRDPSR